MKIIIIFFLIYSFTQTRFNLMREESEGYTKLIIELNKGNNLNENIVLKKWEHIQSLIGFFINKKLNKIFN